MPKEVDTNKFRDVLCPYLPPMIMPSNLQGQPPKMTYHRCLGENCALWDQCQGELSPRANAVRLKNLLAGLVLIVENNNLPKEAADSFKWVKANLEMALKSDSNPS